MEQIESSNNQSDAESGKSARLGNVRKINRIYIMLLTVLVYGMLFWIVGLIHPNAVMRMEFYRPFIALIISIFFLISIWKCIRESIAGRRKFWIRIVNLALGCVLLYGLLLVAGLSHEIYFNGLLFHYKFVDEYEEIRSWGQGVIIPDGGIICTNGLNVPEAARPFNPENVEVKEVDGTRCVILSWNSGFMQLGWELIIYPSEGAYQLPEGKLAEVYPGVYLHYEFYQ